MDEEQPSEEELNSLKLENLRLRGLLEEHLGKRISDEILDGKFPSRFGGERKRVSVLMADLRGFTSFSEKNNPEVVVQFLNRFFRSMTACVEHHGGMVDKFIGDAVLAIFESGHSLSAATCSLEMLSRFHSMDTPAGVGLGIGISSGEVVLGYVGSGRKVDFTVIGSAVNLAARLSSIAGAGEILIDRETLDLGLTDHLVESLGSRAIKGFSRDVEIFSLRS